MPTGSRRKPGFPQTGKNMLLGFIRPARFLFDKYLRRLIETIDNLLRLLGAPQIAVGGGQRDPRFKKLRGCTNGFLSIVYGCFMLGIT